MIVVVLLLLVVLAAINRLKSPLQAEFIFGLIPQRRVPVFRIRVQIKFASIMHPVPLIRLP